MALFNEDQKEAEKLGLTFKKDTKVSDVSGKTTAIRGILNDPSKVSRTTYATPDQKKDVFRTLIAGYFIHDSDYEAALDDLNSPKFKIVPDLSGADAQTKRHYHVIDLVQQIAHELVIGGHADQLADYYQDLQNSSGIDRDTFEGLFYDTLADHAMGIAEYVRTKHVYPRNSVNYAPDVAQQDNIKKKLKLLPKKNFNTYLDQKYGVAATPVVTPAVSQSGTLMPTIRRGDLGDGADDDRDIPVYPEKTATYAEVNHFYKGGLEDIRIINDLLVETTSQHMEKKLTDSKELLIEKLKRLDDRKKYLERIGQTDGDFVAPLMARKDTTKKVVWHGSVKSSEAPASEFPEELILKAKELVVARYNKKTRTKQLYNFLKSGLTPSHLREEFAVNANYSISDDQAKQLMQFLIVSRVREM